MSQPSVEEIARKTATASGHAGTNDRPEKRSVIQPVLVADALYWATDVQGSFGSHTVAFADWKRQGLEAYSVPAGDLVYGADVIAFLREHRKKRTRERRA